MLVTVDRFTEMVTSTAGYDATFLSTTELDAPTRTGLVVLPYTHFTVAIDPGRRLAASTAVNIDGSQLREVERGDDWNSIHASLPRSRPAPSCTPATISTAAIWCVVATLSGAPR